MRHDTEVSVTVVMQTLGIALPRLLWAFHLRYDLNVREVFPFKNMVRTAKVSLGNIMRSDGDGLEEALVREP